MKITALPTSSVGMLPHLLEGLEKDVLKIEENPNEATTLERVAAWARGSFVTILAAALDQVAHVTLGAVKAVPVLLNETLGKLTGLNKYVTSSALTVEDLRGHFAKFFDCLTVQLNALPVLFCVQSPRVVTTVGRQIKLFPVERAVVTTDKNKEGAQATAAK